MSSIRQIEANRSNARLSTGPLSEEGKKRSRQNAVRHGLTAETVITALEDAEDYAAFEMAVTADYDARTAVERELVLRLASLLWRLRPATAIETGLFKLHVEQLLQFRRQVHDGADVRTERDLPRNHGTRLGTLEIEPSSVEASDQDVSGDLKRSFVRLTNLPSYPLDRLSRYEAALWRQACQIMLTLGCLNRRKPWERRRARSTQF